MSASSSSSPSFAGEKKHWWLSNRKIIERYIKDSRALLSTQTPSDVSAALHLLDAALAVSPRLETALELKARSLLFLRRFRDVADMLQDYIPSFKCHHSDSYSSSVSLSSTSSSDGSSSNQSSKDKVKLLAFSSDDYSGKISSSSSSCCIHGDGQSFKCFSVSDLKKMVLSGLSKNPEKEGQWRYVVLGQACYHLGLMEDAVVLLQTAKRLASAAFRRRSNTFSDDVISNSPSSTLHPSSESTDVSRLLTHVKLLLRRRSAALAAHDSGLHAESIRHFTKLLEGGGAGRAGSVPATFIADCYVHRARAYRASGRALAESIADCNRALAVDPSSIPALSTRASLFESARCVPECLRDLEHLKLLYGSFLRDRKLPGGPAWARPATGHWPRYRDVPAALRAVADKINELRGLSGCCNVDYYALVGLRRGCSRAELGRAHLLLTLRHRPDKAAAFVDRCEFVDGRDVDAVRDQARMSALLLYRLLQKAQSNILGCISEEEANYAEKQRQLAVAAAVLVQPASPPPEPIMGSGQSAASASAAAAVAVSVFQGVFCRDLAVVGSLISQAGFNRPMPVKYEALSC
ncbi:hypothetical protein QJS10_CPA05g00262 [Acorus calamus]|uniref:J domain-containing protein n=1 Tax=Acorus calamus TaxID=4465 RepID=A0AAV9EX25_ACOCL|nr:hypothetical protein QJS10_CPA05g00262 [Acorus calamus]